MKASELIKFLQEHIEQHGDIEVVLENGCGDINTLDIIRFEDEFNYLSIYTE